ncbi:MAG: hypothetical protein PHN84_12535 [Desulfuromonadaceae bacterium]|nr:hypothetical protein [Desulfuromonadaceae bacterium]MDD2855795.1 hypothetical protein [Desulfuromonadaceae bacterium]
MKPLEVEKFVRDAFNRMQQANTNKKKLPIHSGLIHEFDLYEEGKYVGGITTSPWNNNSGTTNTGGRDRVKAEILYLSMFNGNENRVIILTDRKMADEIHIRFKHADFKHKITVLCFELNNNKFTEIGQCGICLA